jgi:hypothetical protein
MMIVRIIRTARRKGGARKRAASWGEMGWRGMGWGGRTHNCDTVIVHY